MARVRYDHIHKYMGVNINKRQYRCIIEGCTHIISASLLLGRKAACTTCGEELTVGEENLRRRYIAHINCDEAKAKPAAQGSLFEETAEGILGKLKL